MRPNTLRLLLSSTSLAALALGADAILVGHIAQAQTTINGASTSVKTSVTGDLTINSGGFLQDATKTLILIDASKNVTNSGIALASGISARSGAAHPEPIGNAGHLPGVFDSAKPVGSAPSRVRRLLRDRKSTRLNSSHT